MRSPESDEVVAQVQALLDYIDSLPLEKQLRVQVSAAGIDRRINRLRAALGSLRCAQIQAAEQLAAGAPRLSLVDSTGKRSDV